MSVTTAARDVRPSNETYNAFVSTLSLASIDLVAVSGERRSVGVASRTRFDLQAGFQLGDDAIRYRFDLTAHLTDDDAGDCGQVSASVIITVSAPEGMDAACAEQFGDTSATMLAHPFLREAIASTAQRIGFPGVLLPLVVRQPDQDPVLQPDGARPGPARQDGLGGTASRR